MAKSSKCPDFAPSIILMFKSKSLSTFTLKQIFRFIEDLVFADYVSKIFLQVDQDVDQLVKSRVGFCKTISISRG